MQKWNPKTRHHLLTGKLCVLWRQKHLAVSQEDSKGWFRGNCSLPIERGIDREETLRMKSVPKACSWSLPERSRHLMVACHRRRRTGTSLRLPVHPPTLVKHRSARLHGG